MTGEPKHPFPTQLLEACALTDMKSGSEILSTFRAWANSEIDKIFFNARLVGIPCAFYPTDEGVAVGLERRNEHHSSGCCVEHSELRGTLTFHCDADIVIKQIRIPGINVEYRNYSMAAVDKKRSLTGTEKRSPTSMGQER